MGTQYNTSLNTHMCLSVEEGKISQNYHQILLYINKFSVEGLNVSLIFRDGNRYVYVRHAQGLAGNK